MKVRTTVYAGTYKKIRTGSGGGPAEVIISIVLILAAVFLIWIGYDNLNKRSYYSETTGYIEEITVTHRSGGHVSHKVIVSYSVEGEQYRETLGEYQSGFREGQQIGILYDSANPRRIIYAGMGVMAIFFGLGVAFAVAGIFLFIHGIRGIKRKPLPEQYVSNDALPYDNGDDYSSRDYGSSDNSSNSWGSQNYGSPYDSNNEYGVHGNNDPYDDMNRY